MDNASLKSALLDLRERDQEARGRMVEAMKAGEPKPGGGFEFTGDGAQAVRDVGEIDAESTAFLKRVVELRGWPTKSEVGDDGAGAAWILAQHADKDPEFQTKVLALMEPLVERGEANSSQFALLTDRVLLAQGKPQVYATQFAWDDNGVLRPRPTRDWATIAERRVSVGLPPLEVYRKALAASHGDKVSLEPLPIPTSD